MAVCNGHGQDLLQDKGSLRKKYKLQRTSSWNSSCTESGIAQDEVTERPEETPRIQESHGHQEGAVHSGKSRTVDMMRMEGLKNIEEESDKETRGARSTVIQVARMEN